MHEPESILLANPDGKGWAFACGIQKALQASGESFGIFPVSVEKFRDGEIKPKIGVNVRKRNCFFIHDSSADPSAWFLELCLINQALRNSSAQEVIDVLPYLKFSRQDRKDESRVPISARVVADVIRAYADHVLTIEVHNPAIQGFYDIPFDSLYSYPTVITYLKETFPEIFENTVIMSTDAGGAGRAKTFAKRLGMNDIAIGYKSRQKAGEIESLKILGELDGKKVFIVDDIADSGKTLVHAAQAARASGASEVYGYCTHGLFTLGTEAIAKSFERFYVGDTIQQPSYSGIEVIPFAPLFAQAISRLNKGESLSELFT